jgi:ELWxxDGT repeat protein
MKPLLFALLLLIPFGIFSQTNVIEPQLHSNIELALRDSTFNFIEHNGLVYTIVDDGIHGLELWVFDDEQNSLRMVNDINTNGDSNPIIVSNGIENGLLFYAYDDEGTGLWTTDGTELGTTLLKYFSYSKFKAGFIDDIWSGYKVFKGELYFGETDIEKEDYELWKTDGTVEGTKMLKDLDTEKSSRPRYFHVVGDRLIFRTASADGDTWSTDGTEKNTIRISSGKNDVSGNSIYWSRGPTHYFYLDSLEDRIELWATDGTIGGTTALSDIFDETSFDWRGMVLLNNILYFTGNRNGGNLVLFVTDGTVAGTKEVIKITRDISTYFSYLSFSNNSNQNLFFSTYKNENNSLWVTDGTESGTKMISPPELYNIVKSKESIVSDRLFFTSFDDSKREDLWVSDGTSGGTHFVKNLAVGDDRARIEFTSEIIDGKVLYYYKDEMGVASTWLTDGTEEGTSILNPNLSNLTRMYHTDNQYNNILFFTEISEVDSVRMWQTNMTKEGTSIVMPSDQSHNNHVRPHQFYQIEYNNHIYFFADYYGKGEQLYRIANTITSVEVNEQTELMNVYPNPAKDYVQLELDKPIQLSIISSTGAKVKDYGLVDDGKMNVANLTSGIYFVVDEQGNNIARFVKE